MVKWCKRCSGSYVVLAVVLVGAGMASGSRAQDFGVLIRMLEDGRSPKVRARAAMTLAEHGGDQAREPLEAALRDRHILVRAAAARGLAQLGDSRSVPALRACARRDRGAAAREARKALRVIEGKGAPPPAFSPMPDAPPVRWRRVRYAVVVGQMRNQSKVRYPELSELLGSHTLKALAGNRRLAVFQEAAMTAKTRQRIRNNRLPQFRLEGNLKRVWRGQQAGQTSVRCEVAMLLLDEPERNLRSMLSGAATGLEAPKGPRKAQVRRLTRQALDGAVRSALANAFQAIEGASVRRDLGMK